jgi:hypothetical protein
VVLGVIGFVLQRRQAAPPPGFAPGQFPGMLAAPGAPGVVPGAPGPIPPGAAPPVKPSRWRSKPPRAAPQPVVAAPPPPATGPGLLMLTGPRAGQRIPLQNGFTIGKAPSSHLVLDDGYTSTQHAQVGVDAAGTCRLYDRNSTNGTFVNGVRVNEVVLDHGMSVRIGSIEMRFLAQ